LYTDETIEICKDGVYYLGYRLSLGKAERAVLDVLLQRESGADTFELSDASGVSVGNISTTVKTINRKARAIGGRDLILSGRGLGYRLFEP